MILWINGAFGSGKTTTAFELNRRLAGSFVYDPEQVGYFIRRNTPKIFSVGDFQDISLWREMNYKLLKMIAEQQDGTVIVPMTLVEPDYFHEIIDKLIAEGMDVRHFILYVSREELKRRIKKRSIPLIRNDSFALDSIDRCVNAFDHSITNIKIYADSMSVDQIVDRIAELCGLRLSQDKKTKLGKLLYRMGVTIRHIR